MECLGYGPNHEMTLNRGASMCDNGASIYETDTDSDSESDDEIDTISEEPGSIEKGEVLHLFDAMDAPFGMEIAPSVSLLSTAAPPSTVSDRPNTADSRGATNMPDSSDENADCFEDESDSVKSVCTRGAERWMDTAHRMTEFLSFLMRRQVKFKDRFFVC
jgi:hypothetical protein